MLQCSYVAYNLFVFGYGNKSFIIDTVKQLMLKNKNEFLAVACCVLEKCLDITTASA